MRIGINEIRILNCLFDFSNKYKRVAPYGLATLNTLIEDIFFISCIDDEGKRRKKAHSHKVSISRSLQNLYNKGLVKKYLNDNQLIIELTSKGMDKIGSINIKDGGDEKSSTLEEKEGIL